jgi:polyisoprenoid-binding protein YceI
MTHYAIDTTHSELAFTVRHMMFAKVRGQFKSWKGELAYDAADPAASRVEVEVDTTSIDTRENQRDTHLRSADFFDAEQFPKMTFKSKAIEPSGKGRYLLVGDLTIRDTTRELRLEVEETGRGKDPWGNDRIGFSAKASLSRSDWGLRWNQALETGGVLVSKKLKVEIELQLVKA